MVHFPSDLPSGEPGHPRPAVTRLHAVDDHQNGLAVEFQRQHDRYQHAISAICAGTCYPILQSVEGDSASIWPPSPPLQQLSLETTPAGEQVVLLVGMAGTSHWSLSVEAVPARRQLVFDAACRVKSPGGAVGSSYARQSGAWNMLPDGALRIDTGEQILQLRGLSLQSDSIISAVGNRCQIRPSAECMPVVTLRWKYALEWIDRSS